MHPMRPYIALLLSLSSLLAWPGATGAAAAEAAPSADPAPLTAQQRKTLDQQLVELRAARDPLLKASPLQRIVDLGPAAVEAALGDLLPLLDSTDAGLRVNVVNALRPPVRLTGEQTKRIEKLMADPDEQVRKLARDTLDEMRKYRETSASRKGLADAGQLAPKELLAALASEDLKTRESAAQVARRRIETEPAFKRDAAAMPAAIASLARSPDAQVRSIAMLIALRCFDPLPADLAAAVVVTTEDPEEDAAAAALTALTHVAAADQDAAVRAARKQAANPAARVQGQALATLATLGVYDAEVAKAVKEALAGEPEAARGACAAVSQHRQRQPQLVDRLIALSTDADGEAGNRAEAMKALAIAAEPAKSVPVLERLVETKSEDKRVRIGACTAFMLMAEVATPALTSLQGVATNERDDLDVRKAAKAAAELIGHH